MDVAVKNGSVVDSLEWMLKLCRKTELGRAHFSPLRECQEFDLQSCLLALDLYFNDDVKHGNISRLCQRWHPPQQTPTTSPRIDLLSAPGNPQEELVPSLMRYPPLQLSTPLAHLSLAAVYLPSSAVLDLPSAQSRTNRSSMNWVPVTYPPDLQERADQGVFISSVARMGDEWVTIAHVIRDTNQSGRSGNRYRKVKMTWAVTLRT